MSKHQEKTWDSTSISRINVDDLCDEAIQEFRDKAAHNGRMDEYDVDVKDERLLRSLKLFEHGSLTKTAILLFHPNPELFINGAYIKIGAFEENLLQHQHIVSGPLIFQTNIAVDLIL